MKEFKGKKSHSVSVRMCPMERMLIESRANETGMSMSSYVVLCSLGRELKLLTEEQKTAYKHLATYHSHFSRIGSLVRNRSDIT
ncbi:plasmid mobilization protein, partial [Photobacterium sp. SP02]|uniref:plasmid mobilization protein n=1 Tax=Photobacterium sp. SP02 TaxID=3032280 RepID=UPI00406C0CBA